ncbi:MAG: DUF3800 domain-containing protein [Phycisphaerae bacterium]
MLLFIDESGHDHHEMPCEVLAGVAVPESNLWNLVKAVRAAERDYFGDYLRNLRITELKAKKLLKRKRFRSAARHLDIAESDLPELARSALLKGISAARNGGDASAVTERELVAYSRQVLRFVDEVINVAARHEVQVIASVVDIKSPRPDSGLLRKDYVYLFERYFYLLEGRPPHERGLVVFDELEKAEARILIQQMAAYFLGTPTGRYRSARIVPEPFFVHSELTTGVFLADLAAYTLGWGWRRAPMPRPPRDEISPFAAKLEAMQFVGEKPKLDGMGNWKLYGITYLDDLRSQSDRENQED